MKVTKRQLRRIIREEAQHQLNEGRAGDHRAKALEIIKGFPDPQGDEAWDAAMTYLDNVDPDELDAFPEAIIEDAQNLMASGR